MLYCSLAAVALISAGIGLYLIDKRPDDFHYSRSIVIKAAPDKIFPMIDNLKNWTVWSPWQKMEPTATTTFSGPSEGVGAVMEWNGKKTGKGAMTTIESMAGQKIFFRLDFEKPIKATHQATFTFTSVADGTEVTWGMSGKNNAMGKLIGVLMNCEKMMNRTFDQGLADLKTAVENRA